MTVPPAPGGITLLGLGPGNPNLLTREAWQWLNAISEIYLRTEHHPVIPGLPPQLIMHSFDQLYEKGDNFEMVYGQIVDRVMELGRRPQGVTYAVPGHPFVAEATSPEIARRAKSEGIPLKVIEGISFLEPVFSALGVDPFPRMAMMDAFELAVLHHPNFPPDSPGLITQIHDSFSASSVKLTLNAVYPDEHPVTLIHAAGTPDQVIEPCKLYEMDRSKNIGLLTALYIPPLAPDTSLEAFQEVVARLRAPDGCPWDIEQTHISLRKYLLEETYEALAALDAQDSDALREELGDLMLQIVLHAQIGSEDGEFTMADILKNINQKIVRRHPHVFGEVEVSGVEGVLLNWQKLKEKERTENGEGEAKGMLDGVPIILPALSQSQEIQDRAARVGFDWPEIEPVYAKVNEELAEVQKAESAEDRALELGDLLFAVVNLARWYSVDAESALRGTNQKFRRRFAYIEKRAREAGRALETMTLDEMDRWWEEAKGLEN